MLLFSFALVSLCQAAYAQEWLNEVTHMLDLAQRVDSERQISLTNYKHLGTITGEKEKLAVLDEIFAADAVTVINSSDAGFVLVAWGDDLVFTTEDREKFRKRIFDAIARKKIEVIELDWSYKEQNYKSKALAGGEGIIYDNIASFAIDYGTNAGKRESTAKVTRPIPDEWIDVIPGNMVHDKRAKTFVVSEYSDGCMLLTGKYAWRYMFKFISVFDHYGKLCNRSSRTISESGTGWRCSSGAAMIDGELSKTTYQMYERKWEYGDERGGNSSSMRTLTHRP